MARYQIIGVRKPDRYSTHEHITHLQLADRRIFTREAIIRAIEVGGDSFYTVDSYNGKHAEVEVVHPYRRDPYLQTRADGDLNDNLLRLPAC
jgi:hypothetical protein